jgi:cytidylate kinase
MTVITISRELGSGGTYISRQVAQALGYHLVEKDTLQKVLSQYGFAQFEAEYESAPSFWERLDSNRIQMIEMLNKVIMAVAQHGNVVILGRGSFAVLDNFRDILNVRIQAPLPTRVRRVMVEQKIEDWEKAETLVKESDRVRSTFLQSWYGVRWDTAGMFDLVLDTSKVPCDLAVRWILEINDIMGEIQPEDQPAADTLNVDEVLARVVAETLECAIVH